jgi:sirohydrochlorin cobaltochelatase
MGPRSRIFDWMTSIGRLAMTIPQALLRTLSGRIGGGRYTGGMIGDPFEREALEARLRVILPPQYQDCYEDVQPVSMGSAGLKYDETGRVAWDEMWGSFCDLAMAGGPPHKGKLLEPASAAEVAAEPERYKAVVEEICRGIRMVSYYVAVERSECAGWIRVMCPTEVMAGWLVRAIVMENVSAHLLGDVVELPAGPHFRLEKEVKNVVTVIAKTCHYYEGHMSPVQQRRIGAIFAEVGARWPLLQPSRVEDGVADEALAGWKARVTERVRESVGLEPGGGAAYRGWLGFEVGSVRRAIGMMRALVVSNVLARREGTVLYVPVDLKADGDGERVVTAVTRLAMVE